MITVTTPLRVADHSRDNVGMTWVYPVVSRRAGGVSVGVNLNPNNACNWRCIYCQVPQLKRGKAPPLEHAELAMELRSLLESIVHGDFLERHAPPQARRLVDVAFSGNGEPTSSDDFAAAVQLVAQVLDEFNLPPEQTPLLRLITNGGFLDRRSVREGVAAIGERAGETWFKLDAVGVAAMRRINSVGYRPETVLRRIKTCAALCQTWIQTCCFAIDGEAPSMAHMASYLEMLTMARDSLAGVHLYGLARPSLQPEAPRLTPLSATQLTQLASAIGKKTGLAVIASP